MSDLRFVGLAGPTSGFHTLLKEYFGYDAVRDGVDWVVPATDPALKKGPPDVLKLHHEISLSDGSFEQTATRLAALVPTDFDEYQPPKPEKASVAGQCGIISEVDAVSLQISLARRHEIIPLLAQKVLPLMRDTFGASHVTAVTVDAKYQQAAIGVLKIAYLAKTFGLLEAEKRAKKDVLRNILPHPLAVLSYVESFTVLSPGAFTLPVNRLGCTWHFYRDGGWAFSHGAVSGLLERFQSQQNPRAMQPDLFVLNGLGSFSSDMTWQYLRSLTKGINTATKFLNDPRCFNEAGGVNLLKQIQANSAVALLFADLSRISSTSDAHSRISFTFSALDKLANLRKVLGEQEGTEGATLRALCSLHQARELRAIFKRSVSPFWPDLAAKFSGATVAFAKSHCDLRKQLGKAALPENLRLQWLGAQRNLTHGAFLGKKQFEQLFLDSSGALPSDLSTLPLLLTLGFAFEPKSFLNFRPLIRE